MNTKRIKLPYGISNFKILVRDGYHYREAKIYVIIDEYDHFANEILAFNFDTFKSFVSENIKNQ